VYGFSILVTQLILPTAGTALNFSIYSMTEIKIELSPLKIKI
jgi:hypothetical protein